jgi:hypothetical protein
MGIDALLVIRPKKPSLLRGVLSDADSVDVLEDGTLLLSTFVRFAEIQGDPDAAALVLTRYGQALLDAHDEPRGFLCFPDVCEPKQRTYDALVAALGDAAIWIPARILTEAEQEARLQATLAEVGRLVALAQQVQTAPLPVAIDSIRVQEHVVAQMAAFLEAPGVEDALTAMADQSGEIWASATMLLQRPSKRPLTATSVGVGVNELRTLADGAVIVVTDRAGGDRNEMCALALGGDLTEWVAEHTDTRGVPCFPSTKVEHIGNANTYEDAIARLGGAVEFVRPHTIEDVIAARKQKLRDYLARDD